MTPIQRNAKFGAEHDQFSIEQNMKLIHKVSNSTLLALETVGIFHMEYEDVVQLAMITFNDAAEKFDRNSGNRFSTYYVIAMRNKCKTIIHNFANSVKTASIEEMTVNNEGEEISIYDLVPSEDATPDGAYEMQTHAMEIVSKLSVRSRLVIKTLIDPELGVQMAFNARRYYAELCAQQGIKSSIPKEMDIAFIAKYYGFSKLETEKIKQELRNAVGDDTLWRYKKND